jgi:glycosyltransferase involved in cell wall biosynthesis
VPNAVDQTFFSLTPKPESRSRILCVGHITKRKNQIEFIRALDPLAKQMQFEVHFFGNSDSEPDYVREFLQLTKERSWCRFQGCADRATLQAAMTQASLLVLPSLEDNCPMVVLEAMAATVPVIGPNVGGVPDLIRHEANGLLCNPSDPNSIRQAVASVLQNPQRAKQMAGTAKAEALKRFHPTAIANQHVEIYREVLSTPS